MKISLDLDGTLYHHPDFFRELMRLFLAAGHEVGILTGHRMDSGDHDIEKLIALGFPRPSFYFGRTPDYMHLNGAHYKSMIIAREGIDIHFDDYDYDNIDTIKLFSELGVESRIARMKCARENCCEDGCLTGIRKRQRD